MNIDRNLDLWRNFFPSLPIILEFDLDLQSNGHFDQKKLPQIHYNPPRNVEVEGCFMEIPMNSDPISKIFIVGCIISSDYNDL